MSIQESDILFFVGGACWEQFGTPTRRTTVPRRGGEEDVETFTRSGAVGTVRNGTGLLSTAEADTPRVWFQENAAGVLEPHLILEPAETNQWSFTEDLSNAAWTKTNCTISADAVAAPDGLTTADKVVEASDTNLQHYVGRNLGGSPTDDATQALGWFVAAAERTWCYVETIDKAGTAASTYVNLSTGAKGTTDASHEVVIEGPIGPNAFYHIAVVYDVTSGGTTPSARIATATADNTPTHNGDGTSGIYVWGGQSEENTAQLTSYIPNAGSGTVTRAAELFTVPFYPTPQAMQSYCRFIEGDGAANGRLLQIGDASNSVAKVVLFRDAATTYQMFHDSSAASSSSAVATLTPAIGDLVELLGTVQTDGSTGLQARKNGGATVTASAGVAQAFDANWSGALLTINSGGGTGVGLRRHRAIIGTRGTGHTLDEFAALV